MSDDAKIALVTGASRGIGRGIALRLAADGHFVVGTATTQAGADEISEALGKSGQGYALDVREDASVDSLYASLAEAQGMPLVLVNNAGVTRDNLMLRMSIDEWTTVVDTNINGLYRVTKPVLRGMLKARWGRIVNVSSVVGRMGNPGQSNYVASKSAVEGFTRSLAQEVGSRGITINAVAPGFVATDMTADLTEEQTQQMLSRVPLGRMGSADDIAEAVGFLVSDKAGYITGETLHVNGGLYMS